MKRVRSNLELYLEAREEYRAYERNKGVDPDKLRDLFHRWRAFAVELADEVAKKAQRKVTS